MKLYITPLSPYARLARIVVLEKGLQDRVEVIRAQTRVADSPYYAINPSGRVPYLVRDDGVGMEDSALICAYLDHLDGTPAFALPAGDRAWEMRRLDALARSILDGLVVSSRELRHRPESSSTTSWPGLPSRKVAEAEGRPQRPRGRLSVSKAGRVLPTCRDAPW